MNKSESKYFNTALIMNQALVELLNKKDFDFITIKEICEKAGVNRSTFYLHYENVNDLLEECIENSNKQFISYFNESTNDFIEKVKKADKQDLVLISPNYLIPYLTYIKENKILYLVAVKKSIQMGSIKKYNLMYEHIFAPIMNKYEINKKQQPYFMAYYINGVSAIVEEWIKNGCKDEISFICDVIIKCIRPYEN